MAKLDFKNAARRNKNLKYGGYATIVTVICVVILVVVNLLFEKLNLTIDLTQEELYTVSEETMEILNELDEEVDIYGFYVSGEESGTYNSMVVNFLERYEALNKNLHFELKDPVSDPAFANQFLKGPNETITSGNVVVTAKNTGRYKILALADMLQFSYDQSSSNGYRVSGWNAEAAITGAVQYVTSDKTPALYQLAEEHGFRIGGASLCPEAVYACLPDRNEDARQVLRRYGELLCRLFQRCAGIGDDHCG